MSEKSFLKSPNPVLSTQTTIETVSVIQPKLTINEPGDRYEQEADAMADRVMRMPAALPAVASAASGLTPLPLGVGVGVQRKCAECEKEEKFHRKEAAVEPPSTPPLMRKTASGGGVATPALTQQLGQSKGGGSPLPLPTLQTMCQAFGADFSGVRVHTGSAAAQMNQGIQARAFTHGSDIYFNRGEYRPESGEGKRLLAHELGHVVQQKSNNFQYIQKRPNVQFRPPLPFRPPPIVIPRTQTDPKNRSLHSPETVPRFIPAPDDNSMEAFDERRRISGKHSTIIDEALERPVVTLKRGGSSPDFIEVKGERELITEDGLIKYRIRELHILDAIEYEISQAICDEDIQRVRIKYLWDTLSTSDLASISVPPFILLPNDTPIFPINFDPGGFERLTALSESLRRRTSKVAPRFRRAQEILVASDTQNTLKQMYKRRRQRAKYPICWALQLVYPPSLLSVLIRKKAERDTTEAEQARLKLKIREEIDPDFRAKGNDVHHVHPLFLGGIDDLKSNGKIINHSSHMNGHAALAFQPQLLMPPSPLKPIDPNLYNHPEGTEYEIVGFKEKRNQLCLNK